MDSETANPNASKASEFSPELLALYYRRLFPYAQMFNWLSYGNAPDDTDPAIERDFFAKREFSFTMEDDVYIRYRSFRDETELKKAIVDTNPFKIDIGAVFTTPPKDKETVNPTQFKPVERELVFDIDLTDYDDIRSCCSGAQYCTKCWPFMNMAMEVMSRVLSEDFGFRHFQWFYSGRRGVHCWVCDTEVRQLPNEGRSAVTSYMDLVEGSTDTTARPVQLSQPIHPSIRKSYELLEPWFERYIIGEDGQGLLAEADKMLTVLEMAPSDASDVKKRVRREWENATSPQERWVIFKRLTTPSTPGRMAPGDLMASLEVWRMEVVLKHTYPRIDANVSKTMNHLLKSPFCVHPKTGNVCVPISSSSPFESFDPFNVPTLSSLCAEIDRSGAASQQQQQQREEEEGGKMEEEGASQTIETSLDQYVRNFEREFLNPLGQSLRREFRARREEIAGTMVDF
jgi:DNA primase small subunit